MALTERIAVILAESGLKQKQLAALLGVSASYVSSLLSGRNERLSASLATLIEQKLGYNAQWVMSGEGAKLKSVGDLSAGSEIHQRVILQIGQMSRAQLLAILAFIESLDKIETIFATDQFSSKLSP